MTLGLAGTIAMALLAGAPALAAAQAPATRLLLGRVVRATDGAPLADVQVAVRKAGTRDVARVATRASGRFAVRAPAGPMTLVASRIGFAPESLAVADGDGAVVLRLRAAPLALPTTTVRARGASSDGASFASSASAASVARQLDVALRPRTSSQELLRLVPGLVIAQHAGGGKAEQIFLRGFDADHGTDVAVSVDGVPVNVVSHAHGQGYADLHFLMPEVVDRVDVRKGPYDVRDGDFATAGAVAFRTRDRVDAATVELRGGSFGTTHAVALLPLGGDATRAGGYVAGALHASDGPFLAPQGHRRANGVARWTAPAGRAAELVATASAFDARWDASGQVPDRAVRAGAISRFGAIDASEGGTTSRLDARVALRPRVAGESAWEASAYATRYRFGLFSNFTFFLADSVQGDGIEQVDDRVTAGGGAWLRRPVTLAGVAGAWSAGAGLRLDDADVALHRQAARTRLGTTVDVRARQAHLHQWTRVELPLGPRVRADVGLRADQLRFDVRDRRHQATGAGRATWRTIVSPRANLAVDVGAGTTLHANAGTGFHSNDARDVVQATDGARTLPRAVGAEVGARHSWAGGSVAAALWNLDLQSELVYVGDEGVTEPSGRTRRTGVDVEARARLSRWLWADADVTLSRGRFRDAPADARAVPLAPARTATAGLTVRDAGPATLGLRVRHVGARPATEDGAVRALGHTVWELSGAWDVGAARVRLAVDNLLDATWNEAQFATTSRLRGERAPVTELHYTPGAPRGVQLGVEYRFGR